MGYAHGKKWSEKLVKNSIVGCMNHLGLSRMPTLDEMQGYTGDSSLSNAVSHYGGTRKFSKEIGTSLKTGDTINGWGAEKVVCNMLKKQGYRVERMSTGENFDLLVNEVVKIDVKSGRQYLLDRYKVTTFGINNKHPHCDIYILVDYHGKKPCRTLFIPSVFLSLSTTMSIGAKSKYDKWINRFDVIDKYILFYEEIKKF